MVSRDRPAFEKYFYSETLILPLRTYEVTLATLHSTQTCLLVHREFCNKVMRIASQYPKELVLLQFQSEMNLC